MKRLQIILIALIVVIAGFYLLVRHTTISATVPAAPSNAAGAHTQQADPEKQEHHGIEIDGLQTRPVVWAPVTATVTVTGEIAPNEEQTAKVGSPVAGRLIHLFVKVGQHVRQGETLAEVASRDVAEMQSASIRARTDEQAARQRLQIVRDLAQTGALTQKPLEDAQTNYLTAQASYKQSQAALARARSSCALAAAELERKQHLAAANAYQARPVEDAKGEVAKAQAELDTAQASVKVKQAACERNTRLLSAGVIARRDVESADAALAEASAQEREARTHLEIAKTSLAREENITGQNLYTNAEIPAAQTTLVLAQREVETCTAETERAAGNLRVAQSIFAREKRVAGKFLLARQEVQRAEADLAHARAEGMAAENALRTLRVSGASSDRTASIPLTAPISGVITARQATPGQAVEASVDLFSIRNTESVWVWANVYEKDLAQVRQGQPAEITVTSFPARQFHGVVRYIGEELNKDTRTARIRCEVANSGDLLKSGMFATITLTTGQGGKALLIPRGAVLDDAGKKIVFTPCMDCAEDKAAGRSVCGSFDRLEVTLGAIHGDQVEVYQGLQPGMEVVTTGQYQLKTALGSGQLKAGCCDH